VGELWHSAFVTAASSSRKTIGSKVVGYAIVAIYTHIIMAQEAEKVEPRPLKDKLQVSRSAT